MASLTPYVPQTVVVHLGSPSSNAQNVTVDFIDYIKNVASSELYPTWPEAALRANIYAIVTFTLNRIYTEWYRSQGYNFDITSNTQYDQAFFKDREIFGNISDIVDDIFNDYIRRQGNIDPLFAQYCNGTTVTCRGLSQWGTVTLANMGYTPYEMLQYYYGDDIEIVRNSPVKVNIPSYLVKVGDVVEIKEKCKGSQRYKDILEVTGGRLVPEWIEADQEALKGTIKEYPTREMIDVPVNEVLIVELYSK